MIRSRALVICGLALLALAACKHEPPPMNGACVEVATEEPFSAATIESRFNAALSERKLGAPVLKLDNAEFPPILYGLIEGSGDWKVLHDLAGRMGAAYQHGGAHTFSDGKKMAFALNVVPSSSYPADQAAHIGESLHGRLVALAETARKDLPGSASSPATE